MLILNGVQAYGNSDSDRVARRTVVGQDVQGRIILIATPLVGMELARLSDYLASTNLEIANAFNLDGGGSTMMYVAPGQGGPYVLNSFDPVPAVLAVYPR
jgi:exopolysaccharide biosynthesis protein